jgi:DNA-binding response OmpR family regulator
MDRTDSGCVLIVDDEERNIKLIALLLAGAGYRLVFARNGLEALEQARSAGPDLILLDIMMPTMDGYQFISQLRRTSEIPVIMITAKQQEADIIRGFDLGADDYITKPFRMRELLVRMRAVLRRAAVKESESPLLTIGDLSLDRGKHEIHQGERLIELTPLEFQMLEILMQAAGQVVRRADLAMRLMENGYTGSEATLKIHIRNLRLKLDDDLNQPRYIETVFGLGYRFLEAA